MPNTLSTIYGDSPAIVRKAWYTGRQVGTTFLRPDQLRGASDLRSVVNYDLAIGDIVQLDPFSPPPTQSQPGEALATTQAGLNATRGLGPCVGAPNIGSAHRGASAAAAYTTLVANCVPTPAEAAGAAAGFFQPRLFVVTHVHPDVNRRSDPNNSNSSLAAQRDGGWIDICPVGMVDALFIKQTDVLVPMGHVLGLYQPLTSAAVSGISTYGSSSSKPAFHNILAAQWALAIGTGTYGGLFDTLMRLQAVLMESVDTAANGGGAAGAYSLRKVALGGGIWNLGL